MALLGTMFTFTTYGTWLRGDRRGWVEDGRVLTAEPALEQADRTRSKYPAWVFAPAELQQVGAMIGDSLKTRLRQKILALTVQSWHVHFVVAASVQRPPAVVKCAKDAVRYGLRAGRPIWTDGYDKRFCFDEPVLHARIEYVERHNVAIGLPAQPWAFIDEL